ncbi:MAG: 30S ribosomal protein S16 [Parcubacteria group bacterium GW2011_GWB1_57_6]|nr:MAG: 30S ribosomal protein S16 [Parcubacteria group bacterium GW2011_GWA1_56_13]KKW45559.1 MAG: 30S ribosomal protein S16 [Parcubacteria group bacterium GW2011_GWB1_57_6]
MIRFQRIGRTNDPAFRIVVLEKERAAKTGNIVELLGTYNPRSKALTLDEAKVKGWLAKGAQPTGSIHNLLITKGVIQGKKVNVLSKKTPQKGESAEPAPAVPTTEKEAVPTEAPTEAEIIAEVAGTDEGSAVPAEKAPEETPVTEDVSAEASAKEEKPAA